jgi:hypothetical protein
MRPSRGSSTHSRLLDDGFLNGEDLQTESGRVCRKDGGLHGNVPIRDRSNEQTHSKQL